MNESKVLDLLEQAKAGATLSEQEGIFLYEKAPLGDLAQAANEIRNQKVESSEVTYLVDRNINYTNVCTASCKFCAFYRPPGHAEAYILDQIGRAHV